MLKVGWILLCSVLGLCAVGSSPLQAVGSYYAVCWVFVPLNLLLYRNLGLFLPFVGSLHLDIFCWETCWIFVCIMHLNLSLHIMHKNPLCIPHVFPYISTHIYIYIYIYIYICKSYVNRVWTMCESYVNHMRIACEWYVDHMRILCKLYANRM